MRRNLVLRSAVWAASFAMAVSLTAGGEDQKNPYRVILARNPFNLRPILPPEPIKTPEPPAPPAPKVFLTGIMNVKVLLQMEDSQTRKTEFLPPLAAGERYKQITIVAVDAQNHVVRIRNGEVEDTLDFLNDGIKPKAAAPTPPLPTPTRHRTAPVPPPPQVVPRGPGLQRDVIVVGGPAPDAPAPVNAEARPSRTVPVMTRAEVEAGIAHEREIRQRNNDPSYKLLPDVRR